METLQLVGDDGCYEYGGPVVLCGGPSQEAKNNEAAQTAFYKQMTQEQSAVFAQQQDILKEMNSVLEPIVKAGPNQLGFTPEENSILRSEITGGAAKAEENAVNALQLRNKQLSGGADVLPTGTQAALEGNIRLLGEQGKAEALNKETLANYEAGSDRYNRALAALTGNASLLAPTSYSSAATNAGSSATGAINLADSERSNLLSSILGGVVGAGTSFLTGGLSNIVGGGGFFSPKAAPKPSGTIPPAG